MRSGSRLTLTHLVVFVVVALVLNTQFTWWVVYSLRQNRERLDSERELIRLRARLAASRLELRTERAAEDLLEHTVAALPGSNDAFIRITTAPAAMPEEPPLVASGRRSTAVPDASRIRLGAWSVEGQSRVFRTELPDGRELEAELDPQAPHRWLNALDPSLELKPEAMAGGEPRPVELLAPLGGLVVVPDAVRWQRVLVEYRRRVLVVVIEGAMFFAAMVSTFAVLWSVLRRENELQRQSQNFISAVTHELKTPIAGIRIALETVIRGRADAESAQRFLGNALSDTERLGDLVEKVLEVTRYTGRARRLQIALGDFSQLVEEVVDASERRARARGVDVSAEIDEGIEASFDPEAMSIVISNLVENAVKYAQGPPPSVRVVLTLSGGDAVLEIRDNGVGISRSDLERIFDAFYRAGDEVTRRTPGTGIGLYVAREIVVAHGGRLTAESEGRGRGATFRLVLPAAGEVSDDALSE